MRRQMTEEVSNHIDSIFEIKQIHEKNQSTAGVALFKALFPKRLVKQ
jgi:hypothetical protein